MEKNHETTAVVIIALIVLLLIGVAVLCFFGGSEMRIPEAELPESTPASALPPLTAEHTEHTEDPADHEDSEEPAPEAVEAPAEQTATDYAAIYALHEPEEVVMTVDGREVTWRDYFYAYFSQAYNMEQQFQMYQYYGMVMGWQDQADAEGHSYADLLGEMAEMNLRQVIAVETVAEETGAKLLPEEEKDLEDYHQENIEYFCGADGTEEQLFEQLWNERYMTPEFYWRVIRFSPTVDAIRRELFGADGEKISDQEVLDWMEEQGILSANHILLATVDLSTGQPLDDAAVAEKEELAWKLAGELQAIEDPEARQARFLELKEKYCEDGGDYVFGPGVMVDEFTTGVQTLKEGEVSDPIKSQFGYHIILRRPLHVDDKIVTVSGEEEARGMMLETVFSKHMQDRLEAQVVEYAPGFQAPDILEYIHKPVA